MNKIISDIKKALPALLLIILIAISLSCTLPAPFIAETTPSTPAATFTPGTTPASTPTVTSTPPSTPPPEKSITPTAAPFQVTPPPAGSPIMPDWTPPDLAETELPADLSDIVDGVLPWVVAISTEVTSEGFFGQPNVQQSAGSGWIIDANGLIVTNSHVVEGARSVSVSLNDGQTFQAQQVAADPVSDLAVLKIDASGLPVATVGDSSKLKAGMMVLAVGNALGEGISMTAGWVSQKGVSITVPAAGVSSSETLSDLIQISAPINPGNSGGPLIDMLGEVVGITNVKLVASEVENVGYAISTRTAMPLIEQLIETGQIVRPYLGVSMRTVTPNIASMLNLAVTEGALIMEVDPGSPAGRAGLQQGDVVVKIGDRDITSSADAVEIIRSSQIGQQLEITFYRGNNKSTAQVTLAPNTSP